VAAHDQELAGKAAAAAAAATKGQLAVLGTGGVLTPTNTLAEGLADAPAQATTDVLAAAAGKLTHGSAAAGAGDKGKAASTKSERDADVRRAHGDQDEAVAWATVVEKQGGLHAGEAGVMSQSQGSDAASPFQAEQPDDFSPFQVRRGAQVELSRTYAASAAGGCTVMPDNSQHCLCMLGHCAKRKKMCASLKQVSQSLFGLLSVPAVRTMLYLFAASWCT
jgi:hypothetical protein